MKKNNKKSQIWLVMTGFSCNNNCIICSTKPKGEFYSDRKTEEIIKDFVEGRKLGYDEIDLTGGEPTIRRDILHLIKSAKNLGYKKIGMNTNARMLSYRPFCEKIIKNGLNRITFTLNAHNQQLFDAIVRTPGAFNQSIQGVKNTLKHSKIELSANTVVSKMNYKYLKETGTFINKLGINSWHLLDLIPDGNAKKNYKNLSVKINDLSRSLNNLEEVSNKFRSTMFFDFPLCLFSSEMRDNPKNSFITAKGRMEITKQIGYDPKRFEESKDGSCEDIHKKRIGVCQKCKFSDICAGVWEDYSILYGGKEIEQLAKENNCLDQSENEEIHTYIQIGSACNQKCLFCNRPPTELKEKKNRETDIKIIKKKLNDLAKDRKIKRVIFTGGEPTISSNLPVIISYAKRAGFKTEIQTNGTLLNKAKLKELKKVGLDIINFALHSHKKSISDKLRGVNFGHKKTIENIKLAGELGFEVHLIHVINSLNFKDMPAFVDFVYRLKLNDLYLNLSIVVPEGWAWENKEIIPRIKDIKPYLQGAMKKCRKYKMKFDISEIVPLCIMEGFEEHAISTLFKMSNMKIIDDYFSGQRLLDFNNPSSEYAQKAPQCKNCSFDLICAGFYPPLKKLYGTDDFIPRTDDSLSVIKKMTPHQEILPEFLGKKVEVFQHKNPRNPEILYINLDEKCNQDCVFCVVKGSNEGKFGSMSEKEVQKTIKSFLDGGGKTIVFTGGEPTLRDDLFKLINYAEKFDSLSGVSIITNGVRLADKNYLQKILKSDKKKKIGFSFSLHSHKEKISDLLTQRDGNFKKTISGMKNVVQNKRTISVYHVVTSKNYKDLLNFCHFLKKNFPEIREVVFAYPFPQGKAILNDWINVKIGSLRPYLIKALNFLSKNKYEIKIAACGQFPLCAVPGFEEKVINSLSQSEENVSGVVGEKVFHEFEMATDEWVGQYKSKDKKCSNCVLRTLCQGVWKRYTDLFGFSGIIPTNPKNFKGNKITLNGDETIQNLEKKIDKEKLNLIVLKKAQNNYLEELIKSIVKIKVPTVIIHQNKVLYPK